VRRSLGVLAPDLLLRLHERRPDRYPVLLESVGGDAELGRYDVLFAVPSECLRLRSDGSLEGPCPAPDVRSFLGCLDAWWSAERDSSPGPPDLPFTGGWFLYLGYELAAEIEPRLRLPASHLPRALAWRMHGAVVRDRLSGETVACAEPRMTAMLDSDLDDDLAAAAGDVHAIEGPLALVVEEDEPGDFLGGVELVLEAIARGDVYQANLSRGWRAQLPSGVGAGDLYRRLRAANPAPFAGSARLPGFTVMSSSPERLLRIEGGRASTRPIAGTRPRGGTRERDAILLGAEALAEDRHLRGPTGHAREERGSAIAVGEARNEPRARVRQDGGEHRRRDEQLPASTHLPRDGRREVQTERRGDDHLSELAPAAGRRERHARELERRHREQRSDHPRQRRADPGAQRAP